MLTFTQPFRIEGVAHLQPAGTYIVETEEEAIEGLSFLAYRRIATRIHLAPDPLRAGIVETAEVDSPEIIAALDANADVLEQ